jgi:elongation factor Ts
VSAGSNEIASGYLHGPGRIGVMVKIWISDFSKKDDAVFRELVNDLSLQIAAFAPLFVSREGVTGEYIENIRRQYLQETRESGKPEQLWEKILSGKIRKHLDRICLYEQPYVRDETLKASSVVKNAESQLGANVKVVDFIHYKIIGNESTVPRGT